jgi:threonine dehydratase
MAPSSPPSRRDAADRRGQATTALAVRPSVATTDALVAGVDGCRAGWVVVLGGVDTIVQVVPRFVDIFEAAAEAAVVGVDMPIGLLDRAVPGGRDCDRRARQLLGRRGCCVFTPPVRSALRAGSYARALALNRASSAAGLGISIECFGLFAKLREVDVTLRGRPGLARRVREVHPELAFREMARAPTGLPPKRSSLGRAERLALLERRFPDVGAAAARPPRGAAADDVIDAHAVCWSAARIAARRAVCLRSRPRHDAHGLPMAIWY